MLLREVVFSLVIIAGQARPTNAIFVAWVIAQSQA